MTKPDNQDLPKQISIDYYSDYMHIKRKWFSFALIMMGLFMVFWLGIQGFIFYLFRTEFADTIDVLTYMMIIFVLIDIGLFYVLAAGMLNHTDIFVNEKLMEIKHGPVPWMGNKTINAENITQFFVVEHVNTSDEGVTTTFEVSYMMQDAKPAKLISGLLEREQAEYIEAKIEDYLGIVNVPID